MWFRCLIRDARISRTARTSFVFTPVIGWPIHLSRSQEKSKTFSSVFAESISFFGFFLFSFTTSTFCKSKRPASHRSETTAHAAGMVQAATLVYYPRRMLHDDATCLSHAAQAAE